MRPNYSWSLAVVLVVIACAKVCAEFPVHAEGASVKASNLDKKVVFIAGSPSHGPGEHEHRAGCLLLQKCLNQLPGFTSIVHSNGWPKEANAFDEADAIVLYCDGGDGHPAIQGDHLKMLAAAMKRGVGLGLIHYAVEVPKEKGGPDFLEWAGGYFETYRSVNPFWEAHFQSFPEHPITRGVKPFQVSDEWYYHMRFPESMTNVTAILTAVPPDRTRGRPGVNDAHGGNPEVQEHKGEPEHMMWAIQRPDGGRGFGFTGGHVHQNWSQEDFRKVVLNAIVWISHGDVPANGVQCGLTAQDLQANLDPKR
jgi:type 1 glutamine amidotransferase